MQNSTPTQGLIERLYWFAKLRWLAIFGVIIVVLFSSQILKLPLPIFNLFLVGLVLGVYNLVFTIILNHLNPKKESSNFFRVVNLIANLEISFDLICLAVLIHFSGGIENPFIFYFIFHMIIASVLLSRKAAFLQATFTGFLFCAMVFLEYFKVLQHHPLTGFITSKVHDNLMYISGVSVAFITTIYMSVYMATSISKRLKEREHRLRAANELLLMKDRIKSEYVLRVTHDIKGHLAAIQACIEPVIVGITGTLNEQQKNLLKRANNRSGKLLFFVKALLEITRIKLKKTIEMDYLSFNEILNEAISHVSLRAKAKNIAINSTVDDSVDRIHGTKEYLQEVIINLLANSIKYTPRNGKVNIIVTNEGTSILIKITDNGIGVPKEELPKIFEEFYRASNAKQVEKDGTGLGLSIVKQIIERHNGRVWAQSEEGKGSTFNILLPK